MSNQGEGMPPKGRGRCGARGNDSEEVPRDDARKQDHLPPRRRAIGGLFAQSRGCEHPYLCYEQRYAGAAVAVSATCGAIPRGRAVSAVIDRFGPDGGATGQFVYGAVRPGVASVDVVLGSGAVLTARPVEAPSSVGSRDGFYVVSAPAAAVQVVRAKDRGGKVVDAYAPTPAPTSSASVPAHT